MKKKKKTSVLDFYNNNHHNIIYNNKINLNIYDDYYIKNTSFSNNNDIKKGEQIETAYLIEDINKTLQPNTILQKIIKKNNQKKKKTF